MEHIVLDTAESEKLKRFIPVSKQTIIMDLLNAPHWNEDERKLFDIFCAIFSALYHFKFHENLETLKYCYMPFNPDADVILTQQHSETRKQELRSTFIQELENLLNNANYEKLSETDINSALEEESPYGVSVSVDLEDYADMILYYRGTATKVDYQRDWKWLFLKKKELRVPIYQRLLVVLRFKQEEERVKELLSKNEKLTEKKARKQVKNSRATLPASLTGDMIFLKLFKNIPRHDIEMLFPNQHVRLKLFDKIKLAVTGGGGTIGSIFITITKVAAAANPFALVGAFIGLIGVIFRQIMSIFQHRTKYMMVLSQSLYFHNLDNNQGVISYLIDMAEDEECKEAILAYYFLATRKNYTQEVLDRAIEKYVSDKYQVGIDFEVEDGLQKLHNEGLLTKHSDGTLQVLGLQKACECLDKQWDGFFQPANRENR